MDATCPDCREPLVEDHDFASDEVDDGTACVCHGCGFQIAGRDEAQIKAALAVLQRWSRREAAYDRMMARVREKLA